MTYPLVELLTSCCIDTVSLPKKRLIAGRALENLSSTWNSRISVGKALNMKAFK